MIDRRGLISYSNHRPTVSQQASRYRMRGAHMRITKHREDRKREILDTAQLYFISKGYEKTTVNDILQKIGIAKGTFYYYFKSKEEVMDAIVNRYVKAGIVTAQLIAKDTSLTVYEKIGNILLSQKSDEDKNKHKMVEQFHESNNAAMHQQSLIETLLQLTPVLTQVVYQGIEEGSLKTPYPKETMEFLLLNALFLLDEGLFVWEPKEFNHKIQAFVYTMELILSAKKDSFAYIPQFFEGLSDLT